MTRARTGYAFLDDAGGVLAFAHRGGAYHPEIEGLENTMAAFRHAWALGYTYLETDVHATRDGVLLAFHDDVLDRVTDRRGAIADLGYAEVQAALVGGREQVPTLAQLFDGFPDARFNIDIKSGAAVQPLVDFIVARNAHDRVLVGSFSRANLSRFRQLTGGRIATSADPLEVATYLFSPTVGVAERLTGGAFQAFQVPRQRHRLPVATKRLVRRAHATGKQVHVWTVDDAEEMRVLLDWGVDGLITDRTDVLKRVLLERGDWDGGP